MKFCGLGLKEVSMASKFKPGQIVRLKSGGPPMTVDSLAYEEGVWAMWFAGSKHTKAHFQDAAIELVPDDDKSKK